MNLTTEKTIKQARHILDLTQEQLAKKLGVSRQTVIAWEAGQHRVKKEYCQFLLQLIINHVKDSNLNSFINSIQNADTSDTSNNKDRLITG